VRQNVARNEATPFAVLEALSKDPQAEVVKEVEENSTWQRVIAARCQRIIEFLIVGTPHDRYPNVVWSKNGKFRPADGYCWVNEDDPKDCRVQRVQISSTYSDNSWRRRMQQRNMLQSYWAAEAKNKKDRLESQMQFPPYRYVPNYTPPPSPRSWAK